MALIAGSEREIWEVMVETTDAQGRVQREPIGTTDEHPWRTAAGAWPETKDLTPGTELVSADGDRAIVITVLKTERIEPTYNFEVEGFHTYFVGESGVWVHNACKVALKGPIANFRRALAESGLAPKWMNQWLRQGRSPPCHQVDHLVARSVGGTHDVANLRLRTTADHINRHRFYRPWEN